MTQSISPLVAMQGTLEKMADKFREALPPTMDEYVQLADTFSMAKRLIACLENGLACKAAPTIQRCQRHAEHH